MKWFSGPYFASSILLGILIALIPSATAQTIPAAARTTGVDQGFSLPADVEAALSYPNSSQRFFEEGNAQFEREIQRLSEEGEQLQPILIVQPEILNQFEDE